MIDSVRAYAHEWRRLSRVDGIYHVLLGPLGTRHAMVFMTHERNIFLAMPRPGILIIHTPEADTSAKANGITPSRDAGSRNTTLAVSSLTTQQRVEPFDCRSVTTRMGHALSFVFVLQQYRHCNWMGKEILADDEIKVPWLKRSWSAL